MEMKRFSNMLKNFKELSKTCSAEYQNLLKEKD